MRKKKLAERKVVLPTEAMKSSKEAESKEESKETKDVTPALNLNTDLTLVKTPVQTEAPDKASAKKVEHASFQDPEKPSNP